MTRYKEERKSERLNKAYVNYAQLNLYDYYLIDQAIIYFSGYRYISEVDNAALSEFYYIRERLFTYYKEGRLDVKRLDNPRAGWNKKVYGWPRPFGTLRGADYTKLRIDTLTEYNFEKGCGEIDRNSLIKFACAIEVYPLFLFPDGRPVSANKYSNDNLVDGNGKSDHGQTSKKMNDKLKIIVKILRSLDYDLLNIPRGGKVKVKEKCLSDYPKLFTDSTFPKAWQAGLNLKRFKTKGHNKYSSKI